MSEFLQGMIVGGGLVGGVVALGWWVIQSQRPAPRQPDPDDEQYGPTSRRKRLGT